MDGKFYKMPLFKERSRRAVSALLSRLHAAERHFAAGSYVLRAGDAPRFGLLLSGRVHVVQEDFWGHQSIMAQLSPGALFGESFALGSGQSLPVSVIAQSSVHALFLDPSLLWHADRPGLAPYPQVTGNLVRILAEKNRLLTQKITHVTQRTLRINSFYIYPNRPIMPPAPIYHFF
ncbi:MAG: Crp/Fnr family transcriptional regulator [Christensenellales bacterium]